MERKVVGLLERTDRPLVLSRRKQLSMNFKDPCGNLTWVSVVWILVGSTQTCKCLRFGSLGEALVCLAFALCAGSVWFDVKWLVIPLITILGLSVMFATFELLSPGPLINKILILALLLYSLHSVWKWYVVPEEAVVPAE